MTHSRGASGSRLRWFVTVVARDARRWIAACRHRRVLPEHLHGSFAAFTVALTIAILDFALLTVSHRFDVAMNRMFEPVPRIGRLRQVAFAASGNLHPREIPHEFDHGRIFANQLLVFPILHPVLKGPLVFAPEISWHIDAKPIARTMLLGNAETRPWTRVLVCGVSFVLKSPQAAARSISSLRISAHQTLSMASASTAPRLKPFRRHRCVMEIVGASWPSIPRRIVLLPNGSTTMGALSLKRNTCASMSASVTRSPCIPPKG